ncbi:diacylglycerol/lipid kinase family protein, partial [Parvibaculum sp.]|uniref:diacylglycerol/lipid kinase family protein n=1 Tax=Parvibaculum sp. TaxID=2024848 RepID=UPI003C74C03C
PRPVRIVTDDGAEEVLNAGVVAIANGKYFGGGMFIAPMAEPDDGLFDVIMMRNTTLLNMLKNSGAMREGTHLESPLVTHRRARWVEATPVGPEPMLLDVDGEAPGRLPARFEIIPGAITLRC